jgi:hypothetical protein
MPKTAQQELAERRVDVEVVLAVHIMSGEAFEVDFVEDDSVGCK